MAEDRLVQLRAWGRTERERIREDHPELVGSPLWFLVGELLAEMGEISRREQRPHPHEDEQCRCGHVGRRHEWTHVDERCNDCVCDGWTAPLGELTPPRRDRAADAKVISRAAPELHNPDSSFCEKYIVGEVAVEGAACPVCEARAAARSLEEEPTRDPWVPPRRE